MPLSLPLELIMSEIVTEIIISKSYNSAPIVNHIFIINIFIINIVSRSAKMILRWFVLFATFQGNQGSSQRNGNGGGVRRRNGSPPKLGLLTEP